MSVEQYTPWSDAKFGGILSGSTLYAQACLIICILKVNMVNSTQQVNSGPVQAAWEQQIYMLSQILFQYTKSKPL